tara:strand:+ start:9898 stop:10455 length:558 start_codon:yes stop_codon:yes gene_type:complete
MFKEFKKYCQLALNLDKYTQHEKAIYSIYGEKKNCFFSFCVASIFGFCLIGFPFFAYYLGSNGITGKGWNVINLVLSFFSFFGAIFYMFEYYLYKFSAHFKHDKRLDNYQLPSYFISFAFFIHDYEKNKKEAISLYEKITIKKNLEEIRSRSDELNAREFGILRDMINKDEEERVVIEESIISNH